MEEDSDTPISTTRKVKRKFKAFISESTAEEDKFDNVTKKSKADGTHAITHRLNKPHGFHQLLTS
jgi:hypothetical protein